MINSLCWYSSVNSSGVKKLKYVQGNLEQIGQKETPLFSAQNLILQVIETEEIALQPVHESSFLSLYFGQE
jgi:hypothetical protein